MVDSMGDDEMLTVLIPTYNRKQRLIRTLDALNKQSDQDFGIFISDNASNYSVLDEVLNRYDQTFVQRITLHVQKSNVGADMNIASVLAKCDTQWGWLLGDDDYIEEYAVETIKKQINKNSQCSAIWFSISKKTMEDIIMETLDDLIDILRMNNFNGDWIFMSNKVYNIPETVKYFESMFFRLYTRIPHCIPILEMLKNKEKVCVVNSLQIVKHDPMEHDITWHINSTVTGLRTIMDYNSGLPYSKHKELVKYTVFRPGFIIRRYLKEDALPWNYRTYLSFIYSETYCKFYHFPFNLLLWIGVKLISTPVGFSIAKIFIK
ncbi:hypothetical protein B5G11_12660 [Drancourtella sp. An57]|uniref:glycosyltransferase family 2 protein n=1 Tax=Drancourtella sp. An57 TaxID=1965647 RepID=UPI000B36A97D|nr:glycosyltransferase family A protein [Drancourtella sp. An57]OUN68411.1 hypothetical protein B5G11_12660 [Drancourtella sp. An57]